MELVWRERSSQGDVSFSAYNLSWSCDLHGEQTCWSLSGYDAWYRHASLPDSHIGASREAIPRTVACVHRGPDAGDELSSTSLRPGAASCLPMIW